MKTRLFLAATLSLAAAACATAGTTSDMGTGTAAATAPAPAAAAMNLAGRYEFTTSVQGQAVTGGVEIAGTAGAYTGQITTSVTPPIPISSVAVTGQQVVVVGSTPDGPVTIRMNFTDATAFTGGWELSGDSGALTGRKMM